MDLNAEKIELAKEIFEITDVEIIIKIKKYLITIANSSAEKPMSLESFYAIIPDNEDPEEEIFL